MVQTILTHFVHGFLEVVKVANDIHVLPPSVNEERSDRVYSRQKVLVPWRLRDF